MMKSVCHGCTQVLSRSLRPRHSLLFVCTLVRLQVDCRVSGISAVKGAASFMWLVRIQRVWTEVVVEGGGGGREEERVALKDLSVQQVMSAEGGRMDSSGGLLLPSRT